MNVTNAVMIALVVVMVALLVAWARRQSRRLALGVLGGLSLWLAVTGVLASRGLFEEWTARPPRLLFLPLSFFGTLLVLRRTAAFQALVGSTPRSWPLLAQAFRVPVELILYALYVFGRAPLQVTFEGRNLDVVVGLSAPLVGWFVARGRASPAVVLGWNALGLAVLANTIVTIVTSTPGALHLDWPGAPFTELATWPLVWLPAFLAPLAVALHVVSVAQHLPSWRGLPAVRAE